MKGNIKRLALLVVITVMATFMMAATVTAESSKHGSIWGQFWSPIDITGQYAATGSGTCLVAPGGFDDYLATFKSNPNPTPQVTYQLLTCNWMSVFTFKRDGTGHVERTCPCVIHNGHHHNDGYLTCHLPRIRRISWKFTYEVKRDGSITLTQDTGSHCWLLYLRTS